MSQIKCQMTYNCPNDADTLVTYFDGEEIRTCAKCLDKHRERGAIKIQPIAEARKAA